MANPNQNQVMLPDILRYTLPAAHAIVIIEALQQAGPYSRVAPVIGNFETQTMAQKLNTGYTGPVPGAPGLQEAAAAQADTVKVPVRKIDTIDEASTEVPSAPVPGAAEAVVEAILDTSTVASPLN